MKIMHLNLTSIFLIALALTVPNMVLAQEDIVINSADPSSAEQGAPNLPVEISGTGFDNTITDVKFILHCNKKNCTDTGDIVVNNWARTDSTLITADITVLPTAPIASFDIVMKTSRGRGGKGTTYKGINKFSVKVRPNQAVVSCDVFAPGGTCDCVFVSNENDNIYGMLDNCQTSETLMISGQIRTAGSVQTSGTERLTLTAVNCDQTLDSSCPKDGFNGTSVVANATHHAMVRYINFEFDADVSRGCDPTDDIYSAISFVLDTTLPNGETFPDPRNDEGGPTSLLQVWNTTIDIDSGSSPLCNAIEIIRTEEYTSLFVDPTDELPAVDWKVNVQESWIKSNSYVETGILYLGILKWGENLTNPPLIYGNTIGSPACENPDAAVAILLGPTFNLDPILQVETLVQNNTITMENNCNGPAESFGTAVLIVGEPTGNQITTAISNNDISGAFIGVLIDGTVDKASFKGNTLTGDNDAGSGDIGICSNITIGTKVKPNTIQDYSYPIIVGNCPPE